MQLSCFSFLIYLQRSQSKLWSLQSPPRRKKSAGKHEVISQVHTKHMQMIVNCVTCNNYQVLEFLSVLHQLFISYRNKKKLSSVFYLLVRMKRWNAVLWTVMTNLHYLLHCKQSRVSCRWTCSGGTCLCNFFFMASKMFFLPSRVFVYYCCAKIQVWFYFYFFSKWKFMWQDIYGFLLLHDISCVFCIAAGPISI